MNQDNVEASIDNRRAERVGLDGKVSIRFSPELVEGSGQNVSDQGVFFVAEGRVPVEVLIEGQDGVLPGEIVRIENMGAGAVGIAVKFDRAHPDLVDG